MSMYPKMYRFMNWLVDLAAQVWPDRPDIAFRLHHWVKAAYDWRNPGLNNPNFKFVVEAFKLEKCPRVTWDYRTYLKIDTWDPPL